MENTLAVREGGVEWRPFIVEYTTQEGEFTFNLYAVDIAHAMDRLEELKGTARILGELHAVKGGL